MSIALSVGLLTQALISRELNMLHKSEISSANDNIRAGLRTGPGRLPEPSTLPVSKKKHDYLQTADNANTTSQVRCHASVLKHQI